jgi:hypothetical protein
MQQTYREHKQDVIQTDIAAFLFLHIQWNTAAITLTLACRMRKNYVRISTATYRAIQKNVIKQKQNSVALVSERTIPTERPPIVGEVSANFCG